MRASSGSAAKQREHHFLPVDRASLRPTPASARLRVRPQPLPLFPPSALRCKWLVAPLLSSQGTCMLNSVGNPEALEDPEEEETEDEED